MIIAKIIVKNVKDYELVSKLTDYSVDDRVIVDIYDRCHITVPSMMFEQCLEMLYSRKAKFEIIDYAERED